MQQFLLPDQTPPILEAEMALKAEQIVNDALKEERKTSSPRRILSSDPINQKDDFSVSAQKFSDHEQERGSNQFPDELAEKDKENLQAQEKVQLDVKKVTEKKIRDIRQEPEGQLANSTITEEHKKPVVGCVVV